MRRFATDRLLIAVAIVLFAALVSVLTGSPTVALFVAPWIVLLILGFHRDQHLEVRADVVIDRERVMVGDEVNIATTVSSATAAQVKINPLVGPAFQPVVADGGRPAVVDAVPAGGACELISAFTALEWGTFDMGKAAVEVIEPFGLFGTQFTPVVRRALRVHPSTSELRELLSPRFVRRVAGTHRSPESAQGVEYADIREFADGDSMRDINWRVSARSDELWVSQRHPDRATDVVLLVDSFVETGHDVRAVFGLIASSAIALAESHLGATDRVGLIEFGGVVHWVSPTTGRVQLHRLTDALLGTGLYANAADKELPVLSSRVLPARSFVLAFTPLLDERFIDAIVTARARGHDVAVIECEPPSTGAADTTPIAALSARLYQAERILLRDQLAGQGVGVVQWDGTTHLDVEIGRLVRRRRSFARQSTR